MPKTPAQKKAQKNYRETVEQLAIEVKKGVRDEWRQEATIRGKTLKGLIQSGVDEYIANHPVKERD